MLPIGGADMPVVISLLNAFTGLSAAAAGFALDNVALIVAGTLVGSSGTILTMEMATAMNRSVANVLFAGFGGAPAGGAAGGSEERPHTSIGAQDAAIKLAYADSVVIVPGYGLAVAQAQHAIKEVGDELEKRGVTVSYAIHPVAGRMPGHMNVLLAEADVPYEQLKEMEEINPEMPRTDVAVVIGANDVTNPAAKDDPDSPIAGMPIIEVDQAQQVIVIKRSLSPGFAGIDNDLFYETTPRCCSRTPSRRPRTSPPRSRSSRRSSLPAVAAARRPTDEAEDVGSSRAKMSGGRRVEKKNFTSTSCEFGG